MLFIQVSNIDLRTQLSLLALTGTLALQYRLRNNTFRIHATKALNLFREAGVTPLWSRHLAPGQHLALEFAIEGANKPPPSASRLAISEMGENPLPLFLHVRLDHFSETDAGIAPDLLHGSLVQRRYGLLVVPVARWRVEEDALAVVFVSELDDKLLLLV